MEVSLDIKHKWYVVNCHSGFEKKVADAIMDEAKKEGVVCIKKRDGETFFLKPAPPKKSPLDVKGVDLGLSSAEIVDVIRKGRERQYGS